MDTNTLTFKTLGFKSLGFKVKLLLFTVLLTVLAVAFVSALNTEPASDDSSRVRVVEIEEASNNNDAVPAFENAPDVPFLPNSAQAVFFAYFEAINHFVSAHTVLSSTHARPLTRAPPVL